MAFLRTEYPNGGSNWHCYIDLGLREKSNQPFFPYFVMNVISSVPDGKCGTCTPRKINPKVGCIQNIQPRLEKTCIHSGATRFRPGRNLHSFQLGLGAMKGSHMR